MECLKSTRRGLNRLATLVATRWQRFCLPCMVTSTLKPRCKIFETDHGPVHLSWSSFPLSLCLWMLLSDSLTSTISPGCTDTQAEGLAIWALTFCLFATLSLCLFSRTCLTSFSIYLRCSMNASNPPFNSVSSTWGTRVSRVLLGLRPKSISNGDMLSGSKVSGRVRLIQQAGTTYSSQHLGQSAHNSGKTSCIQLPSLSTDP